MANTTVAGINGMKKIVLKHNNGAQAEIYLHGAHITSFRNEQGRELIMLSKKAKFGAGQAIRGGVPVCWPQFGAMGSLGNHGFARKSLWECVAANVKEGSTVSATLRLVDTDETRKQWDNRFETLVKVELYVEDGTTRLRQTLTVTNKNDKEAFAFTTALHTYYSVPETSKATVLGLKGIKFYSKATGKPGVEDRDSVTFGSEVDRKYFNAPDKLAIETAKDTIVIEKTGFPDAVVWNIGPEKAPGMNDLDDWTKYVCVETGVVNEDKVVVKPGETWSANQVMYVSKAKAAL